MTTEEGNKISGAKFSECRKYRYALWRIWDEAKPLVMFIGLNPSTANESDNDPTIKSVCRIAKSNGYGGVYMMNCFPFISTNPNDLCKLDRLLENETWLKGISEKCQDVIFAWGNFDVVKKLGTDKYIAGLFPNAKVLGINKSGSPKHPLYCKSNTQFIKFYNSKTYQP